MSKIAEQKANERWPIHPWTIIPKEGEHGEIINFDEWLEDFRLGVQSFSLNAGYKEGYEQAEKDFLKKACEWLRFHASDYTWFDEITGDCGMNSDFIGDFRKVMQNEV